MLEGEQSKRQLKLKGIMQVKETQRQRLKRFIWMRANILRRLAAFTAAVDYNSENCLIQLDERT
jgi:hypothetical protein